jgi:hypothetical protein
MPSATNSKFPKKIQTLPKKDCGIEREMEREINTM